jgi:hypothetical protein
MHRPGTKTEREVKVLCNKPSPLRILWNHFMSTASGICGVETEHAELKPNRNPWRICHIILISVSCQLHCWWGESGWEKCPNWIGWSEWLSMPYGPVPYISYTCCYFQFLKLYLHPRLSCDPLHKHVGLILIFLEEGVSSLTQRWKQIQFLESYVL